MVLVAATTCVRNPGTVACWRALDLWLALAHHFLSISNNQMSDAALRAAVSLEEREVLRAQERWSARKRSGKHEAFGRERRYCRASSRESAREPKKTYWSDDRRGSGGSQSEGARKSSQLEGVAEPRSAGCHQRARSGSPSTKLCGVN
jgi:hypothetical protein